MSNNGNGRYFKSSSILRVQFPTFTWWWVWPWSGNQVFDMTLIIVSWFGRSLSPSSGCLSHCCPLACSCRSFVLKLTGFPVGTADKTGFYQALPASPPANQTVSNFFIAALWEEMKYISRETGITALILPKHGNECAVFSLFYSCSACAPYRVQFWYF